MPILVKNGRVYTSTNGGSSGNANAVEMTQAQYNALQSPDPNIIYFITDGTAGYPSADDIEYDNTTSELTADNVQDAIDENASEIATVKSGLMTLTPVSVFSGRLTNITGGYSYITNHLVFVSIHATMNLQSGGNQFTIVTGLPIPAQDSALSAWGDGFALNCRIGTDGTILSTASVTADQSYGKNIAVNGCYYIN